MKILHKTILAFGALYALATVYVCAEITSLSAARGDAGKKDILVLCVGSDWLAGTDKVTASFETGLGKLSEAGFIPAIYDNKENATDEERKGLGNIPVSIWAYPGVVYMDRDGRPVDFRDGISTKMLVSVRKFADVCEKRRAARDSFWEKAESEQGRSRAALIGRGLDAFLDGMPDIKMREIASKYKNKIEEIKKADSADSDGYYFKYTFWYQPFMEGVINKNIGAKNFDANYSYVDAKLQIRVLTKHQRQQLIIGKFRTAMAQGKSVEAMKFLDEAEKIDPKSVLGRGCAKLKDYYTKPVRLDSLEWSGRESRPQWTPTSVLVQQQIKSPGTYSLEFKHRGGNTLFRNPKIVCGGKVLGRADGERRKFDIAVQNVPAGEKIVLEFDMRGTGWFDGRGDIVIVKK